MAAFARRELRVVAGLLTLAILGASFLEIADDVAEGDTAAIDRSILTALRQPGSPHEPVGPEWLTVAAADLTALGSIAVLGVVVLVVGGLFAAIGRTRQALILVVASGARTGSVLLGIAVAGGAAVIGLRQLFRGLLETTPSRERFALIFVPWTMIALALGTDLLVSLLEGSGT